MKYLKVIMVSAIFLGGALVVYGLTTDCENTAGIYVYCGKH